MNIFNKSKNNKIISKKIKINTTYSIKDGIIQKINNDYYFEYNNGKILLLKYNKNEDSINYIKEFSPKFEDKINSVSFSSKNNQIYACLLNQRIVKIIDYNLNTRKLEINKNEIREFYVNNDQFNKCINIGNDILVTGDFHYISLWCKKENENYVNFKKIFINHETFDLLAPNDQYFISVQPHNQTLTIFDINDLKNREIIKNIDSIESSNCLLLFKQYIIINCIKGISLFLIKTKQICQYIINYEELSKNKEIFLDIKNNICILNKISINDEYFISIIKYNMIDESLEPFEKSEKIKIKEKGLKTISINKGYLILCENNVYILKDDIN
jgi:hypothetical protein